MALKDDPDNAHVLEIIQGYQDNIDSWRKEIETNQGIIDYDLIKTDEDSNSYGVVPFVPKSLQIKDQNSFNKNQLFSHADSINKVGVTSLANGTFARIQVIQNRAYSATHPESSEPDEVKRKAIDDYERLKELIEIFLSTELKRDINDESKR